MKYKLGGQRPLDLQDIRAKKRPSIVGVLFVAPAVLLVLGLLGQVAWQATHGKAYLLVPIGIGIASLLLVWAVAAALPSVNPDK